MFKSINGGKLPERATLHSAGFDVFANENIIVDAGETILVNLGICIDLESSFFDKFIGEIGSLFKADFLQKYYLELHPRSSFRMKGIGGGVGIIDIDYRDEIKMIVTNPLSYSRLTIGVGNKIGQLILKRHEGWLLPIEYTKDNVRDGGFGSTDEK